MPTLPPAAATLAKKAAGKARFDAGSSRRSDAIATTRAPIAGMRVGNGAFFASVAAFDA